MLDHYRLLAEYNQWMNAKLYEAAGRLAPAELARDRGAFFGSLLGTLNHLVVGDTIWLKRFASHPAQCALLDPVRALPLPAALDSMLFADFTQLWERRRLLDQVIRDWMAVLTEAELARTLEYTNTKGVVFRRQFSALLLHFFNHQTHHRGQASTLLSQYGQDIGITDLLLLIPEAGPN